METYILNGEKYYYNNGKWLTSSYMTAPLAIISQLNQLLTDKDDIMDKSMDELIEIIDGAKNGSNLQLAYKATNAAFDIATIPELKALLPRATSIYRQIGQSKRAIDIAEEYLQKFGKSVCSSALLTSLAAAYCDVEKIEEARKYANKAKAMSANNCSPELINVYARIKRLEGQDP